MFENDNCMLFVLIILLLLFLMNINTGVVDSFGILCPVTNKEPNILSCIYYPPLNMGFIVASYDRDCVKAIQESFQKSDKRYIIEGEYNGTYILKKDEKEKQVVEVCTSENMKMMVKEHELPIMN